MKVESQEDVSNMEEAVVTLLDTWMHEIDDFAEMMIADGYGDDAHMYALRVYVSAAMNLRNRFDHFVKSRGGVTWDQTIKKGGS